MIAYFQPPPLFDSRTQTSGILLQSSEGARRPPHSLGTPPGALCPAVDCVGNLARSEYNSKLQIGDIFPAQGPASPEAHVSEIKYTYIDGPCDSKILLVCCLHVLREWITWLNFRNMTNRNSAYAVWLGSVIYKLKCLQYDWAWELSKYKNVSGNNLSIDLPISNSHCPSMYTLSIRSIAK